LEATVAEVEVALAAAVHTHRLLHRTATLIAEETGVWSDEVGQRVSRRTLLAGTMYEPLGLSPFCRNSRGRTKPLTFQTTPVGTDNPERRR
jgi:hypothetical protein